MKFAQIAPDTFETLQLGAGIITTEFNPETGEIVAENIIGSTSGGCAFEAVPEFSDFGEDIDNCPLNTMELKKIESITAMLTGSLVTLKTTSAKLLVGAADVSGSMVTPRADLLPDDFNDIWWIGDYGSDNSDETGGFIAIKLINALSTGGFKMQSTSKQKGTFDFEFTGHFSTKDISKVPYELYIKTGAAA